MNISYNRSKPGRLSRLGFVITKYAMRGEKSDVELQFDSQQLHRPPPIVPDLIQAAKLNKITRRSGRAPWGQRRRVWTKFRLVFLASTFTNGAYICLSDAIPSLDTVCTVDFSDFVLLIQIQRSVEVVASVFMSVSKPYKAFLHGTFFLLHGLQIEDVQTVDVAYHRLCSLVQYSILPPGNITMFCFFVFSYAELFCSLSCFPWRWKI